MFWVEGSWKVTRFINYDLPGIKGMCSICNIFPYPFLATSRIT